MPNEFREIFLMANGSGATISEAEKRARTMASLLRTVGTAFIIVVAILMALREIGLDITSLLAGAGVAGVAIGFGAQSLRTSSPDSSYGSGPGATRREPLFPRLSTPSRRAGTRRPLF